MALSTNSFTFNGINSLQYGLFVSGNQTFNSAQKEYEKVSIPGRSGDLLLFNNRYSNVELNYDAILFNDYEHNTANIRAWLLSADGYCRLEDTYHPEEFRMASFAGPVDFDTMLLEAGTTTLTFDCKPQRWLKIGEVPDYRKITIPSGYSDNKIVTSINNPTMFTALPIITIKKKTTYWEWDGNEYCEFWVNGKQIKICKKDSTGSLTNNYATITLDCDLKNCYNHDTDAYNNANDYVKFDQDLSDPWPNFKPNHNGISFPVKSGDTWVDSITITPRWWTL